MKADLAAFDHARRCMEFQCEEAPDLCPSVLAGNAVAYAGRCPAEDANGRLVRDVRGTDCRVPDRLVGSRQL